MRKIVGVYCFKNSMDGKCYIGESVNINRRYFQHRRSYNDIKSKSYNSELYVDIRKYGFENFEFYVLEECNVDELLIRESYYIEQLDAIENGYNTKLYKNGSIIIYSKYDAKFIDCVMYSLLHDDLSVSDVAIKFNIPRTTVSMINNGNMHRLDTLSYPLYKPKRKNKKVSFCQDCVKQIGYGSERCKACDTKFRNNNPLSIISKKTLVNMLRDNMSQADIARQYDVSGNTVKKWRIKYGCYSKKESLKPDKTKLSTLVIEHGVKKVSDMCSVNESTVLDWFKSYGLQLLSNDRVLCVETKTIYESKIAAARKMFPLLRPKDAAYRITIAGKTNAEYRGYHWILLDREIIQI